MNKIFYDELFLPIKEIKQMAIEGRKKHRLSDLRWLSSHIKYQAQDGKFSTTITIDCCRSLTDEDWEQFKNKGYHITFNEDDMITISWEEV